MYFSILKNLLFKLYYFLCSIIIFLPVFTGIRSIFGWNFYLPLIAIIAFSCAPSFRNLPKSYVVLLLIGVLLNYITINSFAVIGRYFIEPILLFYIFYSFNIKNKLIEILKNITCVIFTIYLLFVFYPIELESFRTTLFLFNNVNFINETIFSEISIVDSVNSRIDGFTALSSTSLLLLPTLLVFLVAFDRVPYKSYFFLLGIVILILAINERLSFIFLFFYLFRKKRYLLYIFLGILAVYLVLSFALWEIDFRLGTPYFMLKFGDILRISNLGEFPEEWLKVNSIVNIQITDLVTGGEKLIGVHNHLLSLPIFFGFWGIVLLTLLIVYFIRVYRHFHREPGFIFIFCSLILNMLFHNDGILNMPIYFSLLYVLYYDVNQTIKSREPGENKSFQ